MRVPAILAAAGMAVLGTYYFHNKRTHKTAALICKALATALPGVLMLYWYFCVEGKMTGNGTGSMIGNAAGNEASAIQTAFVWTLAAILCYMAADVLLECKFIVGAACFSAGHLCMIVSFLSEDGLGLLRETERGLRPDYWIVQLFVLSTVVFILCAYEALKKYFPHLKAKGLFYTCGGLYYCAEYHGVIGGCLRDPPARRSGGGHTGFGRRMLCDIRCFTWDQSSREKTQPCTWSFCADPLLCGGVSVRHEILGNCDPLIREQLIAPRCMAESQSSARHS